MTHYIIVINTRIDLPPTDPVINRLTKRRANLELSGNSDSMAYRAFPTIVITPDIIRAGLAEFILVFNHPSKGDTII